MTLYNVIRGSFLIHSNYGCLHLSTCMSFHLNTLIDCLALPSSPYAQLTKTNKQNINASCSQLVSVSQNILFDTDASL